jgi:hypothetical protein
MEGGHPFIRLGQDGESAPELRYSIPESTDYVGTNIIGVDIDPRLLNQATRERLAENLEQKTKSKPSIPLRDFKLSGLQLTERTPNVATVALKSEVAQIFANAPTSFIYQPKEGLLGFGAFDVVQPRPRPDPEISPKILFFERLKISTFLGNYGAGRVIKTFSLFPGEKTTISIRNFKKVSQTESETVNVGSSILDSVTEEAAVDFENSILSETALKYEESEADILNSQRDYSKEEKSGSASALWGLGNASGATVSESDQSIEGEWGTRSAREECAKNVSQALQKHSARSSSKRDVEVNTSSETSVEVTEETEKERTITRQIENVNVSRTLNLVFRQMVQEYISVLHLTDVHIALYDETAGPYPKYSIRELDRFLDDHFTDSEQTREAVRNGILREFFFVFDYLDRPQQFLERASFEFPQADADGGNLPEQVDYLRVRKDMRQRLEDREFIEVQGIILSKNVISMRTEGVVVDAFLGQGEALDAYSQGLQAEAVRELILKNDILDAERAKQGLGAQIVSDGDAERARLFATVFSCCDDHEDEDEDEG